MSAFESTPWEAIGGTVRTAYEMGNPDKAGVEVVTVPLHWQPTEAHKIALLIAAAPELAEALRDCLDYCMLDWTSDDPRAVAARAALAKAGVQ